MACGYGRRRSAPWGNMRTGRSTLLPERCHGGRCRIESQRRVAESFVPLPGQVAAGTRGQLLAAGLELRLRADLVLALIVGLAGGNLVPLAGLVLADVGLSIQSDAGVDVGDLDDLLDLPVCRGVVDLIALHLSDQIVEQHDVGEAGLAVAAVEGIVVGQARAYLTWPYRGFQMEIVLPSPGKPVPQSAIRTFLSSPSIEIGRTSIFCSLRISPPLSRRTKRRSSIKATRRFPLGVNLIWNG